MSSNLVPSCVFTYDVFAMENWGFRPVDVIADRASGVFKEFARP